MSKPSYQIVNVDRDYSKGLIPQFFKSRPPQLIGLIEENEFQQIITKINKIFDEAETVTLRSIIEETLSCFTCGITECCIKNQYHDKMVELQKFLKEVNKRYPGVYFIHPINNGFLCLEISVTKNK